MTHLSLFDKLFYWILALELPAKMLAISRAFPQGDFYLFSF
jgi:hypothetical protein